MYKKRMQIKIPEWTPELAYAIGLLVTDGSMSSDGRHIMLRSAEKEQIENFKKCLKIDNKIGISNNSGWSKNISYRIQIGNVLLYRWFLTIGIYPNKTYSIGAINIPDKYFKDFLRGHLDGDGCITSYQDHYNTFKKPDYIYTRLFIRFISASKTHIIWLRDNIRRIINVKGDLCELKPKRNYQTTSIWQLKFMKKASLKLIPWIYYSKDIPCLMRKRIKAENIFKKIN